MPEQNVRTLAIVQAEYFQTAALLGEKVAQIKAYEADVEKLSLDLKNLFNEVNVHKAAVAAQKEVKDGQQ